MKTRSFLSHALVLILILILYGCEKQSEQIQEVDKYVDYLEFKPEKGFDNLSQYDRSVLLQIEQRIFENIKYEGNDRIISSTPSELKIDTVTFAFYQYIIEETDVPLVNCFPRTKSREGESILSKDGMYELICSYLDNDIQKEFFHRYWYAEGDHQLNSSEWTDVSSIAVSQKGQSYQTDGTLVSINGSSYYKVEVDYYSSDYSWALGISSVFFNTGGSPAGFYDRYDFNVFPWRMDNPDAQIRTILVAIAGGLYGAEDYDITYGAYTTN